MRNLKKFLALVLAMMMTLSLMVTVNAAEPVTDLDSVTPEFQEAVAVLNGLDIITGYETGDFRPSKNITRAETTALIYRLHSGDAQNTKNNLYSTADNIAKFKDIDVNGLDKWSAGYMGYCANQEIIKGVSADRFNPRGNVTGYQALAMALRAIGYGQNGEYEGTGWQTRVATTATKLGMLVNIDDTNYSGTLSAPATRELVAEIVFQAGLQPIVDYVPALGYIPRDNDTLAIRNFELDFTTFTTVDEWGRPGYYWYSGKTCVSDPDDYRYNVVATIQAVPEVTYTDTQRECDVAHDLKISTNATFDLFVNDNTAITKNYLVVATDTVTKVGGQGRLTEVYRDLKNDKGSVANRVVMIDTFLAQVTGVSNAVKDAAGHLITPAKMTVAVYDQKQTGTTPNPSTPRVLVKGDDTNWEYSKGDMILLNAWTDHDGYQKHATDAANAAFDNDSGALPLHTGANAEKAAFEPEQVELVGSAALKEDPTYTNLTQETEVNYAEVLGVAKSTVAKQTVVYWNSEKHDVGGTEYPDQLDLFLNVAGTTTNSDFTWYFDQYNNIIGIGEAIKSNYGVITSIYSSFSSADGATDGNAVAKAHVKYADGTEADVTIDRFLVSNDGTETNGHQAADTQLDGANSTAANRNVVELLPLYDYAATGDVMTGIAITRTYTKPTNVEDSFDLLVSPVASINKSAETKMNGVDNDAGTAGVTGSGYFGIIEQNLFKFVTSGDGKLTAMEVAGRYDTTTPSNENTDVYVKNYNGVTTAAVELKKNAGFLSVGTKTVRLDNNTQIMLKEGDKINVYNGLSALPGDVAVGIRTEVDWSDANGDGIADVLYTKATVKGTVTYGLFYYNGGAAQWNGADKKGTLAGYLNGEAVTLEFDNQDEFNIVMNSMGGTVYAGHLFAVRMTNNVVTELMGAGTETNHKEQFLMANDGTTAIAAVTLSSDIKLPGTAPGDVTAADGIKTLTTVSDGSELFKVSTGSGNDYTSTTKAVWFHDDNAATASTATYNAANGTITTNATVYYLTGVSKTLGNDLSYLNRTDYTNDITIVYDTINGMNTITEIYVTTLPDITPGGSTVTFGSDIAVAPATADDATKLGNYLKGFRTGVFYSDTTVTGTTHATKATMLYFPFVVSTANSTATLEIKDSNGNLLFVETTGATVTAGSHYFSFDFVNAVPGTGSSGGWTGTIGLGAGTYHYNIYVNGTNLVSSGSFTLTTK